MFCVVFNLVEFKVLMYFSFVEVKVGFFFTFFSILRYDIYEYVESILVFSVRFFVVNCLYYSFCQLFYSGGILEEDLSLSFLNGYLFRYLVISGLLFFYLQI